MTMSLTLVAQEDWFETALKQPLIDATPRTRNLVAWDDDDADSTDEEVDSPEDDEDADIEIPPGEAEDDPFDDFDDEDFDDEFDDDFEEELEDDYEIEPDDSEMFPDDDSDEEDPDLVIDDE